jgi:hypothetical protein
VPRRASPAAVRGCRSSGVVNRKVAQSRTVSVGPEFCANQGDIVMAGGGTMKVSGQD